MRHKNYTEVKAPSPINNCPTCKAEAKLYAHRPDGFYQSRIVMCTNKGTSSSGKRCKHCFPKVPEFHATAKEAIFAWNN